MFRNILIVALGIALGYLASAAGGYLLYKFAKSSGWPEPRLGALVRLFLEPMIAILVGAVVGALAKSRAGLLAAFSLLPQTIAFLLSKRLDVLHEVFLIFLGALISCLLLSLLSSSFRGTCAQGRRYELWPGAVDCELTECR
jgi:uncharacterized protein with PQ loop repeat